jgi:hypothetical protein
MPVVSRVRIINIRSIARKQFIGMGQMAYLSRVKHANLQLPELFFHQLQVFMPDFNLALLR